MEKKGRAFTGLFAGRNYRNVLALAGFGPKFYDRAVGDVALEAGMRALDLGCGSGSLTFALARKSAAGSEIIGLDLSADQIRYAESQKGGHAPDISFLVASMDEELFPDEHFDVIMTCLAMHEAEQGIRRETLRRVSGMLKKGGLFVLADLGRPYSRPLAALARPLFLPERYKDCWDNAYPSLCAEGGLTLYQDGFISRMVRRQTFRKTKDASDPPRKK
jgi:demethylmenaquinone methyltransferase/2-methoxy-6-polyprenyl-1,4-benzoquinol methylase